MQDLYQVLRQKEIEIERVRKEIEALQFVIPLLAEDSQGQAASVPAPQPGRAANRSIKNWPAGRDQLSI